MNVRLLPAVLFISLAAPTVLAQSPEEKGLQIAQEADSRGEGFGDFHADMKWC